MDFTYDNHGRKADMPDVADGIFKALITANRLLDQWISQFSPELETIECIAAAARVWFTCELCPLLPHGVNDYWANMMFLDTLKHKCKDLGVDPDLIDQSVIFSDTFEPCDLLIAAHDNNWSSLDFIFDDQDIERYEYYARALHKATLKDLEPAFRRFSKSLNNRRSKNEWDRNELPF